MKLTIKIAGTHKRDDMIMANVNKLGLSMDDVVYDDRPNGGNALYTTRKAWLSPRKEGETHRLVIQDDVELCDGFLDIVNTMIETHPNVTFTLMSPRYFFNVKGIEDITSPYVDSWGEMYGQAIIMPVEYIEECFTYIDIVYGIDGIDDADILDYNMKRNHKIVTTVPTIIQHIGDESLITPWLEPRRSLYYNSHPTNIDWTNKEICVIPYIHESRILYECKHNNGIAFR